MRDKLKLVSKSVSDYFSHQLGHALAAAAVSVVVLVVATLGKALKNNESAVAYLNNPLELVSPILITILIVMLFVLWGLTRKNARAAAELRRTLNQFGIRSFSRHFEEQTKAQDWELIRNDIRASSKERGQLCLLGATGVATFANLDAPLAEELPRYAGQISVLLVSPLAEGFNVRVKSLSHDPDAYRKEILDSIDYCQKLAVIHKRNVRVKVYSDTPIWKLIFTNRALWVWHYEPQSHVQFTSLFGFQHLESSSGMVLGFQRVFERRWNHPTTVSVDLEKWSRDKWYKTLAVPSTGAPQVASPVPQQTAGGSGSSSKQGKKK